MNWILTHWDDIVLLSGMAITAASIIASLTDTPVDDDIIAQIKRILGRLGFAKFYDAYGSLKFPGQDPE